MRSLIVMLICACIGLQYKLWLGDGNILQWRHLEKSLMKQKKINQALSARNRATQADIIELKSGSEALEEQARYELGMVKDGEIYYQFIK